MGFNSGFKGLTRPSLTLNTLRTLKCVAADVVELDTSIALKLRSDSISITLTINWQHFSTFTVEERCEWRVFHALVLPIKLNRSWMTCYLHTSFVNRQMHTVRRATLTKQDAAFPLDVGKSLQQRRYSRFPPLISSTIFTPTFRVPQSLQRAHYHQHCSTYHFVNWHIFLKYLAHGRIGTISSFLPSFLPFLLPSLPLSCLNSFSSSFLK